MTTASNVAEEMMQRPIDETPPATARLRVAVVAAVSVASAIGVGVLFRRYYHLSPLLPRPVYAAGALVFFAAGTLVWFILRRRPQEAPAPSMSSQRLMHVLYWIGVLWLTLAAL